MRKQLHSIFGSDVPVYLDLFHAISRVTRCIPKQHPFSARCIKDFAEIFRQPGDNKGNRKLPTPTWKHSC
jgi:hypothetical protein